MAFRVLVEAKMVGDKHFCVRAADCRLRFGTRRLFKEVYHPFQVVFADELAPARGVGSRAVAEERLGPDRRYP